MKHISREMETIMVVDTALGFFLQLTNHLRDHFDWKCASSCNQVESCVFLIYSLARWLV